MEKKEPRPEKVEGGYQMIEFYIIMILAWLGVGQIYCIIYLIHAKRNPKYYFEQDFKPQSKLEKVYFKFMYYVSIVLFPLLILTFKLVDDIEENYILPRIKERWIKIYCRD